MARDTSFPYIKIKEQCIVDFNNEGEQILNKLSLSGISDVAEFLEEKILNNKKILLIQNQYYFCYSSQENNSFDIYLFPMDYIDITSFFDIGLLQHELKNPLTVIKGTTQLLDKKTDDPFVNKCTKIIQDECDRLYKFIENLKIFFDLKLSKKQNDMGKLINKIADSLSMVFDKIVFKKEIDPNVSSFLFDYEKMHIALQNILKNCCEAQKEGEIQIFMHIDPTIKIHLHPKNKLYQVVKISIIDKGGGLEKDILENIFKPFFTTKNKGMGLGLSIAKEIIDAHKGKIEVITKPGEGTAFNVFLPYIKEEWEN